MQNNEITFAEAWELYERVKHHPVMPSSSDFASRWNQLTIKLPPIMRLLKAQHEELQQLKQEKKNGRKTSR